MARPKSTAEPRNQRIVNVLFPSRQEMLDAQAHAKRRGLTLAGLVRSLVKSDISLHGPLPPAGGVG